MFNVMKRINFEKIAEETGVTNGKIVFSSTFNSWVVVGHPEIDMIKIEPPYNIGDEYEGHEITDVMIIDNKWCFECEGELE